MTGRRKGVRWQCARICTDSTHGAALRAIVIRSERTEVEGQSALRFLAPPRILEVLEQLRVGGEEEPGFLVEARLEGLHALHELVQLGVPTVGAGVDGGGGGVGSALLLLRLLVALGAGREHVALLLPA